MDTRNQSGARRVNWGIVGTGAIARAFAEGLRSTPGARLAAVASRRQETAAAFAQRFGAARSFGSYESLAQDSEIDAVYIATPNVRHLADCALFIGAGKATLCEKPLAMTAADAAKIAALSRERKVFAMEAMWMRFMPLILRARELVRDGAIGQPLLFDAAFGYPIPRDPANRFLNPELGGGALLDRGVYPLSLAYFLFGAPKEIDGQAHVGPTGVDEQSTVSLKYEDGLLATLTASMNTFASNRATIIGSKGQIEIAPPFYRPERLMVSKFHDTLATSDAVAQARSPSPGVARLALERAKRKIARVLGKSKRSEIIAQPIAGNGYNYEAAEVARCLELGHIESPLMSLDESVRIAAAIDGLLSSWRSGSR